MFSPRGMFTRRDTADQIWKAFRSALMWAKVKSYLRHSKERGVRGLGSPCLCQCVFSGRQAQKKRKKSQHNPGGPPRKSTPESWKTCQNILDQKGFLLSVPVRLRNIITIWAYFSLWGDEPKLGPRDTPTLLSALSKKGEIWSASEKDREQIEITGSISRKAHIRGFVERPLLLSTAHIFPAINALTLWSHQKAPVTRRQHMLFPTWNPNDIVKGSPFIFMRRGWLYTLDSHTCSRWIYLACDDLERGSEGGKRRAGGERGWKNAASSLSLCPCAVVTGQIWLLISPALRKTC